MNIAFIGEAAVGKDFLSTRLTVDYGYTRYAFADEIYTLGEKLFPSHFKEGKKPRYLLQLIGDTFRRIDKNVWVDAMFRNINRVQEIRRKYSEAPQVIIVTDCRYPNEYERLKKEGYIFIRVTADEEIIKKRMIDRGDIFKEENLKHTSEMFYDVFDYDYLIKNNGDKKEAYKQIDSIMCELMNKEII